MICPICSSSMSEPITELFNLPTVASDCRPWSMGRSVSVCSGCGIMKRVINPDFNSDVYREYTSYPEPTGRTEKVLEFIRDKIVEPMSILDIGSGNGHGMEVLGMVFPNAVVRGYEPVIGDTRPDERFDLITLFHVFEHVENLHEMLDYIKASLNENGHVLIQVPYTAMWPFDLVIADHEWHFNVSSLAKILNEARFKIISVGNDVIAKEITLFATPIENGMVQTTRSFNEKKDSVDWLLNFKEKLDSINEPVAVYGTSVSAMWAGNILGDRVICYLDDDITRLGEFNGRSVFPPISCYLPIIAPFPDWQLADIKTKNPNLRFL